MDTVAIIMTVYKGDNITFVKQAVESILNQTYNYFQFWILLDGKVDLDIENYFEKILLHESRIKLLKRLENKGLSKSLNELLNNLLPQNKFEFIARMDADDISMPDRIEKQVKFMEENPSIDCMGTWAIEIDHQGKEFFRKKMPETHADCVNMFMKRSFLIHSSVMFRAHYFDKVGLYPEVDHKEEDIVMWANGIEQNCVFANLPEYLLLFRLNKSFFERRQGIRIAWNHLIEKIKINHRLKYPLIAYIYTISYFFLQLLPTILIKFAYRKLR